MLPHVHLRFPPRPSLERGVGLLSFISLTIIVSALFFAFEPDVRGSVSVLVRGLDDSRAVYTLDLATERLTERSDVLPDVFTTRAMRTYTLDDGSVVSLAPQGIVRRDSPSSDTYQVLVASPVEPRETTPLAVTNDGSRLAWVHPADSTVQVFERTTRGAYVPVYVSAPFRLNSLGFVEGGAQLVGSVYGSQSTALFVFDMTEDAVQAGSLNGFASIVSLP